MNRLLPLAKGGVVGVVLVLLSGGTAFCQTDSSTPSYRLEKIGIVQCDFGSAFSPARIGNSDEMEFRVSRSGDFYFIFYEQGKIGRFDGGGKLVRSVATGVPLSRRSSGFALSPEGDLFVLAGRGKNLQRYDASLDLIGKYPLAGGEGLDPVFGFAATSWGEMLAAGGLKANVWKLEPEGQSFSAKPVYLPESFRYSSLSEMEGGKLIATDPLGALMVMDRYGNLLRTFSFRKGLRAVSVGENFLVTFWPYTKLMVLDTVGVVLANWKAVELDSAFATVTEFQVERDRAYFLLSSLNKVAIFKLERRDTSPLFEGTVLKK
ncbi:MAG: hypothetical protein L0209_07060 [candidate division Zixibacteria bacterium]|nr:hypothetical protein [candidate division Zixibacteria bacterium]